MTVPASQEISPADLAVLSARLGSASLEHRRRIQHQLEVDPESDEAGPINVQRMVRRMRILSGLLRASGLAGWGRRNMLAIQRRGNILRLPGLPAPFHHARLLHLSDLHADMDPGTVPALLKALQGLEYDAVILTGDYRAHTHHEWDSALALCCEVAGALLPHAPIFAVLGNHDPIEIVPGLEALGWRVLLNEAAPWRRGGAELWFAGVDDEHTYANADIARARAAVPADACAILLSHTPSTYARAAAAGFTGFLCGHTHGGQICLPGGYALLNNGRAPRWTIRGPWEFQGMAGYTSSGVGACRVPARFFCPPEVTLHTLEAP